MPIYLDLHPSPQFDRSLVTYCVVNFGRVKDAIVQAGKRIYYDSYHVGGPWPFNLNFGVPFNCDMVIWSEVSFWANVVGFTAMTFLWDGAGQMEFSLYFNEINSHKAISSSATIKNVAAGNHIGGVHIATPNIQSDASDRWRMQYTYYEL